MNEYTEITRAAFVALTRGTSHSSADSQEAFCKIYYHAHGVEVMQIDNYLSFVSQFYIRDINA